MGDNLGQLSRALAANFHVISLDLRNHGRSPWHDSMSLDEMAADVIAYLDHAGINSTDIVGHSLGGKVAMQLALNYPTRARHLVVADIAPVEYGGNHNEVFNALKAVENTTVSSRADAADILSQHIVEPGVRQFLLKSLYRSEQGNYRWRMNVAALEKCYEQLRAGNSDVTAFTGPTLFIKGESSAYIQSKHQPILARLFPHYQLAVIEETGHWLHVEKPQQFNQLVERFLLSADGAF
jgi:esterase